MSEIRQGLAFDHPSKTFLGVHFVLIGFDPIHKIKVLSKLVDGGGVDVGQYGPSCTHVIVDQLVYDDPICVAARTDVKILVTSLWVDHSFDIGMPISPSSIVYRPLRDLNGIPGSKSLVVCLTGYQRQDRDDIMTMVSLMGANFSKPLVASKVTHLVCFKFEGEKYELAKKTKKIKLVNHRWLEDCLKAWEILPETDYDKSGYELEIMEAIAKDSEDTPEAINTNLWGGEVAFPHLCQQISKQEVSSNPLDSSVSKGLSNAGNANDVVLATGNETTSEIHNAKPNVLGSCETTTLRSVTCGNDFAFTSRIAKIKRSPCSDESKKYAISYSRKTPRKTTPPMFSEKDGTNFSSVKSTSKGTEFLPVEEQNGVLPGKRKMDISSSGGSKLQKMSQNPKAFISEGSLAVNRTELFEPSSTIIGRAGTNDPPSHGNDNHYSNETSVLNLPQNPPFKISTRLSASFEKESLTPGGAWEPDIARQDIEFSPPRTNTLEVKNSDSSAKVDLLNGGDADEQSKPLGTKMFGKKFLRSRRSLGKENTTDERGSVFSNNSALQNDAVTSSVGEKETSDDKLMNSEKLPAVNVDTAKGMKKNDARKSGKKVESISVFKDDENELAVAACDENCEEVGPDKIDCTVPSDNDKDATEQKLVVCGKKTEQGESANLKNTMQKIRKRENHTSRKLKKKVVHRVKKIKNSEEAANEEGESDRNDEKTEIKDDIIPQVGDEIKRTIIGNKLEKSVKLEENTAMVVENVPKAESVVFILSGNKLQRKEFQQVIRRLNGRVCRDSHQWSYQATHFIVPDPIRRTEKFCAAAASGRWILKSDYLTASKQEGKFLPEEPYEWHRNGLSEDGAINLQAPRKWHILRERTGHGAFYGMRIIIYGDCIVPPLDTLKRFVKAGDGTILATSPPYRRFLKSGVDFAVVSAGMPRGDTWVQEFLRHEIPCVVADYLVEYVCKPGYSLERHVQFNTHNWAEKSFKNMVNRVEEINQDATILEGNNSDVVACHVCGAHERGEAMVICGHKSSSGGCGVATHVDCCDPPLECIPEEEWWCPKCSSSKSKKSKRTQKNSSKKRTSLSKRR